MPVFGHQKGSLTSRHPGHPVFICADGLTGLDKALEAAFPKVLVQTCGRAPVRVALRYVSWAVSQGTNACDARSMGPKDMKLRPDPETPRDAV